VRFVQFAKDHIQLPRSYGSPQTAANRNNQPQKKNPDDEVRRYKGEVLITLVLVLDITPLAIIYAVTYIYNK
jgi:hypothetical protein